MVALNLLWPYFADSALSAFFPLACFGLFGMMWISIFLNMQKTTKPGTMLCYFGLVMWSLLMIGVYGVIYSTHSTATFLFFSMDSYAIFFIRVFVSILPCMIYVDYSEFTIGKLTKASILLALLVTAVFTSKAVAVNPDALRARALMEFEGLEDVLRGTPAYAMTYSYALLFPVFFHKYMENKGRNRLFYLFSMFFLAYIIIVAQYATALLLAGVGVLVYLFVISNSKQRTYIVLYGLLLWGILLLTDGGSDIIRWIARNVDGAWRGKLEDIALSLSGQQDSGSVSGRKELYGQSWETFMKSPILGMYWNAGGKIGGHATAIDVLGLTGIVGFVAMMACVYGNFVRMCSHPSYQTARPAVIACTVEFIGLIFYKNIITSLAIFFTFFALVPLFLKAKEEEKNEPNQEVNI